MESNGNLGWIKLFRSLIKWEWYDDHNATRVLIHLLITVNHKDSRWKGRIIKAGSRIISWEKFSKEMGLTVQQARTAMAKLKVSGEVTSYATNKFQVVSLVKWEELQSREDEDNKQEGRPSTDKQQTSNKQVTTSKEGEEGKEDKNINIILLSSIKISDVEEKLIKHFEVAKSFQKMFIKNLKAKNSPTKIQENVKFGNYVHEIRRMYEIDQVTDEQIRLVYDFLSLGVGENEDSDFWKDNILSAKSLRKKFQQLVVKARGVDYKKGDSKIDEKLSKHG